MISAYHHKSTKQEDDKRSFCNQDVKAVWNLKRETVIRVSINCHFRYCCRLLYRILLFSQHLIKWIVLNSVFALNDVQLILKITRQYFINFIYVIRYCTWLSRFQRKKILSKILSLYGTKSNWMTSIVFKYWWQVKLCLEIFISLPLKDLLPAQ